MLKKRLLIICTGIIMLHLLFLSYVYGEERPERVYKQQMNYYNTRIMKAREKAKVAEALAECAYRIDVYEFERFSRLYESQIKTIGYNRKLRNKLKRKLKKIYGKLPSWWSEPERKMPELPEYLSIGSESHRQ
jgi:hypothetical protein